MKIAQIPHIFLPHVGGLEKYVFRLSRDLTAFGEDVCVLTSNMNIKNYNLSNKFKFNLIYFRSFLVIFRNPFAIGLALHLIKNNYDIIHAHSIHTFPTIISMIFKKNSKFIITAHGIAPEGTNKLHKLIWKCYIPISRFVCKKSDKLIVLGQKEKDRMIELLHIDESKIEIIPNGIDVPEKPTHDTIQKFMQKFDLSNCKVVLYAGRVVPIKNPEILLNSFSLVKKEVTDAKLAMVGPINEEYKKKLLKIAQEKNIIKDVIFSGYVTEEELFAAYTIADVFVSLGGWEGLPTTMLEAIFFDTPCIMFNTGGIGDIMKDGETGIIINELDCKVVGKKIITLLEDIKLRERLSQNAKNKLLKNYMWETCFNKIYAIYKDQTQFTVGRT